MAQYITGDILERGVKAGLVLTAIAAGELGVLMANKMALGDDGCAFLSIARDADCGVLISGG